MSVLRRINSAAVVISSVLLGSMALTHAQTTPGRGQQIIDQAVAALGGDRFLNMKNRVEKGRIYGFFRDQLSGLDVTTTYVEYLPSAPAKGLGIREREILGKKQDYSYLFLPDQAWDITFRGARPVEDEDWSRHFRTTENDILYILKVRHNEPGLQFDYSGSEVMLSTHVEVVDVTDSKDRTVRVYFDHNTMLPIRETFSWQDPQTREHNDEEIDYDKWRDAGDGVMWPFTIERQRNGYKTYQMFASHIEVNQQIPANTFELPPGAKVLKKAE
ncbi:MAG TPA: hypothetical protein VH302_15920 [Bryobacteraceae bacterium]|nr:hypothetical protein [Bryobacteraceae bacterium]